MKILKKKKKHAALNKFQKDKYLYIDNLNI